MIFVATPVHGVSVTGVEELLSIWDQWDTDDFHFCLAANGKESSRVADSIIQAAARHPNLRLEVLDAGEAQSLGRWDNLLRGQQLLVHRAKEIEASHVLWHEVSRIPPAGAYEALRAARAPVAGALYKDTYQPGYYCVWEFDETAERHLFSPYLHIDANMTATRVAAIGFGFTLIERDLLCGTALRAPVHAADTYFFADLARDRVAVLACPVFAVNTKIDRDPAQLAAWENARNKLLAADAEPGAAADG